MANTELRAGTGVPEFDKLIGGGIVPGSVILLGGPPGVGKSTIVLQIAAGMKAGRVLYVSAEESPEQVAGRARRLGLGDSKLELLGETEVDSVLDLLDREKSFSLVVVDSIQTVRLAGLMSAAGTVAQVRESAARLAEWAKRSGASVILIGHVTKDGQIAGPKVLEHLVDVVCYLDEEAAFDLRILRASKNRYGSVGELGLFEMTSRGLAAVPEDELPWIGGSALSSPSIFGVVTSPSRAWLCEVQALVTPSSFQYPRRISIGFELNRLAMLLAVIEKHLKIPMATRDIHVNVAGGLRILDSALDLPVIIAVLGSYLEQAPETAIAAIGEVGLGGEVRRTSRQQARVAEAKRFGIPTVICGGPEPPSADGVVAVNSLQSAVQRIFGATD
jgi:DNA repair protein RadA/Sms